MPPLSLSRRRLVRAGAAALSTTMFAGRASARSLPRAASGHPELSGTLFDLTVGRAKVDVAGRRARAALVNGILPGPVLRWREGDTVALRVRNTLAVPTSIHWHGIRSPSDMDGVPGLSFRGILPGETFTYRIPLRQSGTYWYHSHSGMQEQTGLYGAIIVEPRGGDAQPCDRDHVVLLSDWTDQDPATIMSNLKQESDYYNRGQRTLGTFVADAQRHGLRRTVADRIAWAGMRMSPTDIADVSGATYAYLLNGTAPAGNWTGLFRPGERVRLRLINGSAMTFFDVRIPGLRLSVVAADGRDVVPVAVDELRIGVAETYDVIVEPRQDRAYTIFAQSEDRSGFARGTLATRLGMAGPVPVMDPRPLRSMADMGMGGMGTANTGMGGMAHMDAPAMPGLAAMPKVGGLTRGISVDNVAAMPTSRLDEAGVGLDGNGRRVLRYTDLRALRPGADRRPPSREITLHLTGNMERYMWGFDGRTFSKAEPIRLALGERVRFTLVNDTMMEHPIHLHGLWSELENGQGPHRPYKHTVIVKPGERLSYLVTADAAGRWAYHCHLLYHMEMGMFRTVIVA